MTGNFLKQFKVENSSDNSFIRTHIVFVNGKISDELSNMPEDSANTINFDKTSSNNIKITCKKDEKAQINMHTVNETLTKGIISVPDIEISLEKDSELRIVQITHKDVENKIINNFSVKQDANSTFSLTNISLGGHLTHNKIRIDLEGENAKAGIYGLSILSQNQLIDNSVLINHYVPNCTSSEFYKCILSDSAKSVFKCISYVHKGAGKTKAYQQNNNLLLSKSAEAISQPLLEIFADDVKCSHGVTYGKIDEKGLFYLISRGINPEKAQQILLQAYTHEITSKIKYKKLRKNIELLISKKLKDIVDAQNIS